MINYSMHSNDYACPFCSKDTINMYDPNVIEKLITERFVQKDFDRLGNEIVVLECPFCFEKYYYHLKHAVVDDILKNKINKLETEVQAIVNADNMITNEEKKVIDDLKNIKQIANKILISPKQEIKSKSSWIIFPSIIIVSGILIFIIYSVNKKGRRRR